MNDLQGRIDSREGDTVYLPAGEYVDDAEVPPGIASISASGVAAVTHAVSLTGVGGTYTVSGGTVNGTTNGDALRVSGGNAVATWNNMLAATAAGRGPSGPRLARGCRGALSTRGVAIGSA